MFGNERSHELNAHTYDDSFSQALKSIRYYLDVLDETESQLPARHYTCYQEAEGEAAERDGEGGTLLSPCSRVTVGMSYSIYASHCWFELNNLLGLACIKSLQECLLAFKN
jgi:hypothetical protein